MTDLTAERLKELLRYEPETGHWFWLAWHKGCRRNLEAGSFDSDGYRRIKIGDKAYRCGRLAWLSMKGTWPPVEIDHEDTDRANDKWENLQLADRHQNGANRKIPVNNTSGYKGVTWDKRGRKWRAQIKVNGKTIKLGSHDDPAKAHAAYCAAALEHFGKFAKAA